MFYTIYKVVNKFNDKIYIGKHQTKDLNDGYMGSGKHLKHSQEKYGIENFTKEILFVFNTEDEMNAKESELVTKEFCLREDTYNLCPGGKGGFGFINQNNLNGKTFRDKKDIGILASKNGAKTTNERLKTDKDFYESWRKSMIGRAPTMLGKNHTEETKNKMRKSKNVGAENSQFGTMWITDGFNNKKIRNEEAIPEGWQKGRKLK